jgi:hypothetical protein
MINPCSPDEILVRRKIAKAVIGKCERLNVWLERLGLRTCALPPQSSSLVKD